jgi:AMP-binding enzyme C-terminal domain
LGVVQKALVEGGAKLTIREHIRAKPLESEGISVSSLSAPTFHDHPRLGRNAAAAVVLQQDATATPAELRKFVCIRLAPFKVLQRSDIVSSVPKNRAGKAGAPRA